MLTIQEIILSFALIGVLGGWAMGRIGSWFSNRTAEPKSEERNHRTRSMEADLRIAQRKAEEAELALERNREEMLTLREALEIKAQRTEQQDAEVERLRQSLSDECAKTQGLRLELTDRAEQTIRAGVRVKEAETELSVARAGSDAVLDQVSQLAAEREELTGRLKAMQSELTGRTKMPKITRLPVRDPSER